MKTPGHTIKYHLKACETNWYLIAQNIMAAEKLQRFNIIYNHVIYLEYNQPYNIGHKMNEPDITTNYGRQIRKLFMSTPNKK